MFYLLFLAMIYKTIRNCYALNKPNSHLNWKLGYQMTLCLEAGFIYFVICAMFMTCDQHPHQFLAAGLAVAVEKISASAISRQTAAALTASSPASGPRSLARPRFAV